MKHCRYCAHLDISEKQPLTICVDAKKGKKDNQNMALIFQNTKSHHKKRVKVVTNQEKMLILLIATAFLSKVAAGGKMDKKD